MATNTDQKPIDVARIVTNPPGSLQPYYSHAGITIYHGDCREILPRLPTDSVDLIVTDPPYGIKWQGSGNKTIFDPIVGDDSTEVALAATDLALRILKRNRHIYLFGRYDLASLRLSVSSELIWNKGMFGLGDVSSVWGTSHEYIQFSTNPKYSTIEACQKSGVLTARLRRGSVLNFPRANSGALRHPAEKPAELLCELIESSSRRGETVLDYFAGIGSTLVACRMESRMAIGIEIEEKYCEIAAKRLSQRVFDFGEAR